MKKKKTILAGLILLASGCIYSQETRKISTDTTHQIVGLPPGTLSDSIKTVTITATRTEKDVMDVGRSVTVISPDQIKQASCNTLAELLSQQEGIFIDGTSQNPGAIQSIFMRGADDNSTTIMIDGSPITDPSTDAGELDLSELALADVDRIEIVRGSHSTLYGSSSIGGVINIITKKGFTPGIHASASITGGEFGSGTSLFDGNVLVNYTLKNGLYATGGYHRFTDKGLNATVDTFSHPLSYQMNPDKDNFQKSEPFAKIGFYNKTFDIFAEYKNINQSAGIDYGAFQDLKDASNNYVRDFYTWGATYKPVMNFNIQLTGAYSHDYRIIKEGWDTSTAGYYSTTSDMFTGTYQTHNLRAEYDYKTTQFIVGCGVYMESMTTSTYYADSSSFGKYVSENVPDSIKFKQTTSDIYAQADINGGSFSSNLSPFSLLLGARMTSNSLFGNNISYELNPYYKVNPKTILYISYSTGFKTPSLYQLYSPEKYGDDPTTSVTLGNSKLKSETSTSFEAGIKHRVSDNLFFTAAWFETVVNNHIDYVQLWTKNRPIDSLGQFGDNIGYTYLNLGTEITSGFEITVFLKLSSKLDFSGNISLLSSTLKYNQSNIDTSQTHNNHVQVYDGGAFLGQTSQSTALLRRPGALGNFSITWHPVRKLALTLRARYVGSRFDANYDGTLGPYGALAFVNVGDYTLLDASASYAITKNASFMVRGENLFNTTYYEILGYTTRGRSFYVNLRYAF